jgi:hypothetical protein
VTRVLHACKVCSYFVGKTPTFQPSQHSTSAASQSCSQALSHLKPKHDAPKQLIAAQKGATEQGTWSSWAIVVTTGLPIEAISSK